MFASVQSAKGKNLQCFDLTLFDDHSFENNETLKVILNSTQHDADVVRISKSQSELLLIIIELPTNDSMLQ